MIPIRLELNNFGAIPHADINLTGVDLAAITGPNGAGKSTTFTIAPIFALFGGTKNGCSADDMVRSGEEDCAVVFDFEHRGEVYRVRRTRSRKGRGKSSLDLQKKDLDQWESLSGATIRETEEKIRNLLNLDAETFVSSSMILQGKANEFTSKPAAQRKAILSQILGLEIYEDLLARAKSRANAVEIEIETGKARILEISERLSDRPDITQTIAHIDGQIAEAKEFLDSKEENLQVRESELAEAKQRSNRTRELHERVLTLKDQKSVLERRIQEVSSKRDQALSFLEQEEKIIEHSEEHDRLKDSIKSLEVKEPKRDELRTQYQVLAKKEKEVTEELSNLSGKILKLSSLLKDRESIEEAVNKLPDIRSELAKQQEKRDQVLDLEKQAEHLDDELKERVHRLERDRLRLESEIQSCESQTSKLADAHCVDLYKAEENPCAFLKGAMEASKKLQELKPQLKALIDPEIGKLQTRINQLHDEIRAVHYDSELTLVLGKRLEKLESLAMKFAEMGGKAELLQNLQEQEGKGLKHREDLRVRMEDLKKEGKALSEELAPLDDMRRKITQLKSWVDAMKKIPQARAVLEATTEQLQSLQADFSDKENEVSRLQEGIRKLALLKQDTQLMQECNALKVEIKGEQEKLNQLHAQLGALKAKLQDMDKAQEEKDSLKAELKPKAEEFAHWHTLVDAFGRNGIPALIIENAVPELERISNEILSEMTHGKHSLRFETQRELKSRAGVSETLDIIVSDWMGERPYETFSGGEQLRVDFAIRFALAELLANRAGSRVEWLTIDEGLGSQDDEHRGMVLDAIQSVSNRFKKTLVITHLKEAQGVFPQQIRFSRTGDAIDVEVA